MCMWSCAEGMDEARICIQASDFLDSGYIQSPMMQFNIRRERWSRLHCAYRMKCKAPSFSGCHRRGSKGMWHLSHMSITIYYICLFECRKLPPVLIQHHEQSALCICVCVGVWDVVSWFVSAMQVLVWFQGLNTSPFLWEEVCVCALCKACHVQKFTKKVHALKVWISSHLVHGHVQHKR